MPTTRQGANVSMTLEAIQAMIDQTLLRNNTTDDGSQNSGGGPRRPLQPIRVCSYTDFMKCQPLNFKWTEGVVKFATCTLLGAALTWWNGHVRTLGHDAAYAMTWEILKKKLTDKYFPKGEIKKLEIKLWDLKVKGNDVGGYTQRFQELALMCTKFISNETEKVDKNSALMRKDKLRTRGNSITTTRLNNNVSRAVGAGEKKSYGGLNLCAPNATITMMESVHPSTEARGIMYALGGGETNQDLDNTEDDINA
nr:hypothetical protein [Tanacetum cinerariifolium]